MRKNNTAQTRGVFSSSSSNSSSRSYSPSSSSSVLPRTPRIRTMEKVSKDLTFPPPPPPPISFHHQNPNPNPNNSHSSFRDFLAGPFKDSSAASQMPCDHHNEELPSLMQPPTALSLNSTALDHFEYQHSNNSRCVHENHRADHSPPFVPPAALSDAGLFSFCPIKRSVLDSSCGSNGGGDRRHKRMMKNRESAARSRARKQAYTNELELEVAHLVSENEELKKQYEELSLAMAAQHSTKKTLQRTLTAPF